MSDHNRRDPKLRLEAHCSGRSFYNPNFTLGSDEQQQDHCSKESMALSLGNPQGWAFADVTQPPASAPSAGPASHFEAREGPSPAQWQAVKEEIRVLYEKKPLKDVKRILERRGFRATYVEFHQCRQPSLFHSLNRPNSGQKDPC